ncbi:MAG: hypothetical protein ABJC79_03615 [Acidimicrobiia bacterium]
MAELDLVREELRELATPVIEAAGSPDEPFGIYIFSADQPESELARHIERTVFDETFGNPSELLDAEYLPYEGTTLFYTVLDHRRRLPAGMMRIILPSDLGLKTFQVIRDAWSADIDATLTRSKFVENLDLAWDVTTLAVGGEYRGKATDGLISLGLYQTLVRSVVEGGGRWLVTILDMKPLELIQTFTHNAFRGFDGLEARSYLDSPLSIPMFTDIWEWRHRILAADADTYALLFDGIGIEPAMRPPEWAPLLRALGREPARPAMVRG